MLAILAVELIPPAVRPGRRRQAAGGAAIGAAVMLALAAVLGV
jgi:hypothetical protein